MATVRVGGAGLAVACTAVALLSGCAGGPGDDAAAGDVATAFSTALSSGDGVSACELLASSAVTTLEEESGASCDQAIVALGIPAAGPARTLQAYGRGAQVRFAADVVFLTLESAEWRVSGAGCSPRPGLPYRCDVTVD